ncbi:MAG TPA: CRTAC1 family protein [Candidatus Thalassarchaeaceae archaeon]|nr:CRTAC1 family protein [Candidatus Thalassarchaeaceae archaeon]
MVPQKSQSRLSLLLFAMLLASVFSPTLGVAMQNSGDDPAGVSFTEVSNSSGLAEINPGPLFSWASYGPGAAWGDYDGDGDLDLYVTVRHDHQGYETREAFAEGVNDSIIATAIAENDSGETFLLENRDGQFVDVSENAGVKLLDSTAIGATWADYDNDGDFDLYISNYGVHPSNETNETGGVPNIMFANNGNGTFTDVTNLTNLGNPGHSTSGLFADYDHDGDLDIYSLNAGTVDEDVFLVRTETNILYRNDGDSNGDGVPEFSDQTIEAGRVSGQDLNPLSDFIPEIAEEKSHPSAIVEPPTSGSVMGSSTMDSSSAGTGVSWAGLWFDYNQDGWSDLFVASDFGISPLYENQKDGTFKLVTQDVGLNIPGTGMGAHSADIDGDGDFDLCQTNFGPNYIWINQDGNHFEKFPDTDVSNDDGKKTGVNWDCHFFDYDLDGDFDLFMTSGRINVFVSFQENALYNNDGNGFFTDVTVDVGLGGHLKSMGGSLADFDGDGDVDILVANSDGPLQLYENNAAQVTANHWLKVELQGEISNRYGVGQLVEVELDSGKVLRQQTYAGSGFLGSSEPAVHFGLGSESSVKEVRVHWSTGHVQIVDNVSVDGTISVLEEAPPPVDGFPSILLIVVILVIVAALIFIFGNSVKQKETKEEDSKLELEA